eukprot:3659006-Ditylum_brightwellii.AAC.1
MLTSAGAVRMWARKSLAQGMISSAARMGAARGMASMEAYEDFGKHVFSGTVADEYLKKHGASGDILNDPTWTQTHADTVAAAVLDWAVDNGANVFCHWFQPMAASGVRHGQTGQVQNMMMKFNSKGEPEFDFKGKDLIK